MLFPKDKFVDRCRSDCALVKTKLTNGFKSRPLIFLFVCGMALNFIAVIFLEILFPGVFLRTIFFYPDDTFMDFFNSIQYGLNSYDNHVIYPPLMSLVYGLIGFFIMPFVGVGGAYGLRTTPIGAMAYFLITVIFIWIGYKIIHKKIENPHLASILFFVILFSYPVLMAIERGNNILYAAIFLGLFLLLYDSEKQSHRNLSYLFLGIAISIKLFPAIFLVMILKKRDLKETLWACTLCIIIFVLPSLFLNDSLLLWVANLLKFSNQESLNINYDLSGFLNYISLTFSLNSDLSMISFLLKLLLAISIVLIVLFSKSFPDWKNVALLAIALLLCGSASRTYTFIYFLIPLIMFLSDENEFTKKNIWYTFLFISICALMYGAAHFIQYGDTSVWITADYPIRIFVSFLLLFTLLADVFSLQRSNRKKTSSG